MKKYMVAILTVILMYVIIGCKTNSEPDDNFLSEVMPNIEVFSDCVEEMFCADVDFEEEYVALYESEQSYDNGNGQPILLYRINEEMPEGNYFTDPTQSSYYAVRNFKTNEEVMQYLSYYMANGVIEEWFHNDFLEYQGKLYLQRGSRGYGALVCDTDSAKFLEQKENQYYVTVDFFLFDELYYVEILEFTKIDNKWMITKAYQKQ